MFLRVNYRIHSVVIGRDGAVWRLRGTNGVFSAPSRPVYVNGLDGWVHIHGCMANAFPSRLAPTAGGGWFGKWGKICGDRCAYGRSDFFGIAPLRPMPAVPLPRPFFAHAFGEDQNSEFSTQDSGSKRCSATRNPILRSLS